MGLSSGEIQFSDTETKLNILSSGVPNINELREVATHGQKKQNEYGISIYKVKDGEKKNLINKGKAASIFEPETPNTLLNQVESGIFFHNHPITPAEEVGSGTTLGILPSGYDGGGDFQADGMSKVYGGYMNIITKDGITIKVGKEGISRDEFVTRTLRGNLGDTESKREKVWKFKSDGGGVNSLSYKETLKSKQDAVPVKGDVITISHTDPNAGITYFIYMSWDKVKALESVIGGTDNLFFGDGLDLLVKELNIDIPHEKNMQLAIKNSFQEPSKRNTQTS